MIYNPPLASPRRGTLFAAHSPGSRGKTDAIYGVPLSLPERGQGWGL